MKVEKPTQVAFLAVVAVAILSLLIVRQLMPSKPIHSATSILGSADSPATDVSITEAGTPKSAGEPFLMVTSEVSDMLWSDEKVVEFVKSKFKSANHVWNSCHAKWARRQSIISLTSPGSVPSPIPRSEMGYWNTPYWIVVCESTTPIRESEFDALIEPPPSLSNKASRPLGDSYSFYAIVNAAGEVDGVGAIDIANRMGTPENIGSWGVDDVRALPSVPTLAP